MAVIGNFLALYLAGQRVALATSNDFASKMAMIDITEKESAGNKEVMPGMDEASANLEAIATSALTNYLQFPEAFNNAIWVKGGTGAISGTKIANDNGQLLAQTLTWGTGTTITQTLGTTDLAGSNYVCFSVYLKGTGSITLEIGDDASSVRSSTFTLSSSWTRYSLIFQLDSAISVYVKINKVSGTAVSLYAPQLENGQTATLYKGSKVTLAQIADYIKNRTQVSILHSTYLSGDKTYQYNGYLTDLQVKASANDATTFSVSFTGTGAQTISTL